MRNAQVLTSLPPYQSPRSLISGREQTQVSTLCMVQFLCVLSRIFILFNLCTSAPSPQKKSGRETTNPVPRYQDTTEFLCFY